MYVKWFLIVDTNISSLVSLCKSTFQQSIFIQRYNSACILDVHHICIFKVILERNRLFYLSIFVERVRVCHAYAQKKLKGKLRGIWRVNWALSNLKHARVENEGEQFEIRCLYRVTLSPICTSTKINRILILGHILSMYFFFVVIHKTPTAHNADDAQNAYLHQKTWPPF